MRASASRMATSTLPNFELTTTRQMMKPSISARTEATNSAARVRRRLHVEAENVLEIGQSVVAAEAEIVAEEAEHQRKRQCLSNDREIHAGDAAAECEPAEHESQHARHEQHHESRIGEMLKSVPVDRQFRPVQEHHEIGQYRMRVDAARSRSAASDTCPWRSRRARRTRRDRAKGCRNIPRSGRSPAPAARSTDICRTARRNRSEMCKADVGGTTRLRSGTSNADCRERGEKARSRRDRAHAPRTSRVLMPRPPGP